MVIFKSDGALTRLIDRFKNVSPVKLCNIVRSSKAEHTYQKKYTYTSSEDDIRAIKKYSSAEFHEMWQAPGQFVWLTPQEKKKNTHN